MGFALVEVIGDPTLCYTIYCHIDTFVLKIEPPEKVHDESFVFVF